MAAMGAPMGLLMAIGGTLLGSIGLMTASDIDRYYVEDLDDKRAAEDVVIGRNNTINFCKNINCATNCIASVKCECDATNINLAGVLGAVIPDLCCAVVAHKDCCYCCCL